MVSSPRFAGFGKSRVEAIPEALVASVPFVLICIDCVADTFDVVVELPRILYGYVRREVGYLGVLPLGGGEELVALLFWIPFVGEAIGAVGMTTFRSLLRLIGTTALQECGQPPTKPNLVA